MGHYGIWSILLKGNILRQHLMCLVIQKRHCTPKWICMNWSMKQFCERTKLVRFFCTVRVLTMYIKTTHNQNNLSVQPVLMKPFTVMVWP